jgi:hypothetical protein
MLFFGKRVQGRLFFAWITLKVKVRRLPGILQYERDGPTVCIPRVFKSNKMHEDLRSIRVEHEIWGCIEDKFQQICWSAFHFTRALGTKYF